MVRYSMEYLTVFSNYFLGKSRGGGTFSEGEEEREEKTLSVQNAEGLSTLNLKGRRI